MVFQYTLEWTMAGSGGGTTVLHSDSEANIGVTIAAWQTAWNAVATQFPSTTRWTFDGTFRELNTASGQLVTVGAVGGSATDAGDGVGQPVANASQILLRWRTPDVVAGRQIAGRTYLPGASVANLANGDLGSGQVTNFTNAFQGVATAGGLFIWHRPKAGAGGSMHQVTSCSVWPEMAVQRRRR